MLSYPCKDDKSDRKREQRWQLLKSLPVSNVSIAVDLHVNLNVSDNASHAALLLNRPNFKADLEEAFSEKANASLELEYLIGPLSLVCPAKFRIHTHRREKRAQDAVVGL